MIRTMSFGAMLVGSVVGMCAGAFAQPGVVDYAAVIGGTGSMTSYSIAVDDSGNVLLGGTFDGLIDFDPGPGTAAYSGTVDAIGTEGAFRQSFVAKYDDTGALVFVRTLTGYGNVRVEDVHTAHNGDLLLHGAFETFPAVAGEELDFDPGVSAHHVASAGTDSMFLLRLNPSGNFVSLLTWTTGIAQRIGAYDFVLDQVGNIYLAGMYEDSSSFDADPGPGVVSLPVAQGDDGFLIKLNPAGEFVYAYTVNGAFDQDGELVRIHPNGDAYLLGQFSGTVDFDPGAGVSNLVGAANNAAGSVYLARLDSVGNLVSASLLVESVAAGDSYPLGADFDRAGNLYVSGALMGDGDFDPSAGSFVLNGNPSDRSSFVAKFDNGLALQYGVLFGASGYCRLWSLDATPSGTVYAVGDFKDTVDFDPGAGVANLTAPGALGQSDGVLVRLNPDGTFNYAFNLEGDDTTRLTMVDLDSHQQLRFGGHFAANADADPNAVNGYPIVSGGSRDLLLAKLNPEPVPPAGTGPRVLRVAPVSYFNLTYPVFEVEFNEDVSGVDATDFVLSGSAGAGVFDLVPVGGNAKYQVAVSLTPTEGEYVRLSVLDDDSIRSVGTSEALGGAGVANGSFDEGKGILIKSQGVDDDGGNLEYAFGFGGTGDSDVAQDLVTDFDGNTFVVGTFSGTVDFDPGVGTATLTSAGVDDAFVARFDADGQFVFAQRIGGVLDDEAIAVGIDAYGNDLYVAGHFQGAADFDPGPGTDLRNSLGQRDLFVSRFDQDGNYVSTYTMGGTNQEAIVGMHVTNRGNFVLAGYYNSPDFDIAPGLAVDLMPVAQDYDMFLAGFYDDGAVAYSHHFGAGGADRFNGMTTDKGNRLYLVGSYEGDFDADPGPGVATILGTGAQESFVLRMGVEGDYQGSARLRDAGGATIYAQDVALDVQRNVHICGVFGGTADFDPHPTNISLITAAGGDPFVVKLDNDFNFVWARNFETTGAPSAFVRTNAIVADRFGAVTVAGYFDTALDFDPGAGVSVLTPANTYDGFLARLNADGSLGFAHQLGATNVGTYNNLHMELRTQHIFAVGFLDGTADMASNDATFLLTDPVAFDGFVAKMYFEHPTYYLHLPFVYDMVPTSSKALGSTTIEVTFTEDVTGVDMSDFALEGSGSGSIVSVTGSGNTYLVTVLYDDESGPVALSLLDDDSIVGVFTRERLGGTGLGNGDFGGDPLPSFFTGDPPGLSGASPLGLLILAGILLAVGMVRCRGRKGTVDSAR